MLCLAGGALTMASCADDDLSGMKFDNGVYNTQLEAPSADDIKITQSADGMTQVISWPVVMGAGGYHAILSNADNGKVLTDTIVDGVSFATDNEEDTHYQLQLSVCENKAHNNSASGTVTKAYDTFTVTYATIPSGTDLYEYFTQNPAPEQSKTEMIYYALEPGGEYTMSQSLDFGNHQVTLRATSSEKASVKIAKDAHFVTCAPLALKHLNIDASETFSPLISLSKTPDEGLKGATGTGDYYNIMGTINLTNCNITGVNNNLIYDEDTKYCVETFLINNCVIKTTYTDAKTVSAMIYFKKGFANTLQIKNSTIWNAGNSDPKYFIQYENNARCSRAGYSSNIVNIQSSTFYNVAKTGQWANYKGFGGQKTTFITVTSNIFVDCGNKEIVKRIMVQREPSSFGGVSFGNNTYMFNGEFESTGGVVDKYDVSGTAIEEDPGFKDAANGDFTISGATQIARKTGDPRWIPEAE